jgi:hypothetical protein
MTPIVGAVAVLLASAPCGADLVRVRYPEGPAHGYLVMSDETGRPIAHGELIQWIEKRAIASRLVFHYENGSFYDEVVHFTQQPVFRVTSYHLIQRGPSFTTATEVEFDRSGRYRAMVKAQDKAEERAAGTTEIPDDVANGMISTLLKNFTAGASAKAHMMTFRPKPLVVDLALAAEGSDRYWMGRAEGSATRFVMTPHVPGVTGVFADITGKQPSPFRMWIAQGQAPVLVKFEGPLYLDGPTWHIELTGPRWSASK